MAISILNNIASIAAQNQLSITNASLNTALLQLSSGSRINTGADDAAGLAVADGLQANVTALTQSARNASDGVGNLQVADGSLAQVTTLLNRAVTLATEASTGTISNSQRTALDTEFTAIKAEIDSIGANTNYNGTQVFNAAPLNIFLSDSVNSSTISTTTGALSSLGIGLGANASNTLSAIANPTVGKTVVLGATTYTFAAAAGAANTVAVGANTAATLANLAAAINGSAGAGVAYGAGTTANASATAVAGASTITFTSIVSGVGAAGPPESGKSIASTTNDVNLGFSNGATFTGGVGTAGLTSAASAQAALTTINSAIQTVAGTRGTLGASVNRLQAAANVINNQVQNLTGAEDNIRAADIPSTVATLAKYSILEQTGISALAQANQQQQLVLKLLQ
jgi:flagellin